MVAAVDAIATSVPVPTTEYENLTLDELVAAYRQAYLAQGFSLSEQKTTHVDAEQDQTRLVFQFPISRSSCPNNGRGIASFVILSPRHRDYRCVPCSVYAETLSIQGCDDDRQYATFLQKLIEANRRADDAMRISGKSKR
jgi:hypothetical protein